MSQFLSFIGWSFLPNIVTGWVQTIYYGLTIRAGDPKPAPGSARYASHRRVIHILVVTAYLLYTIYEADYDIRRTSHFYADLGVGPDVPEREIKSRFRRVAAQHHPDKSGAVDGADYFIHLKLASETLQDAAKRFAYERFGMEIMNWSKCKSIRDYITRGVLQGILPHYGVAAATIYVVGLFGYMDFGKFYRWLILIALCTFEVAAVTRPHFPPVLDAINTVLTTVSSHPPLLPFQAIILARKLTITVYIALSQIGPLLALHINDGRPDTSALDDEKALNQGLDRLDALAKSVDKDTLRLMEMETAPFQGNDEATSNLKGKMREWLVQNTIRADPMVRGAVGTSFRRRRIDAPAGAKGNR